MSETTTSVTHTDAVTTTVISLAETISEPVFVSPRLTTRETIHLAARIILNDLRKFSWLFMLGLTSLSCYHIVRLNFFYPRDYYAYQGASGPYEYIRNTDGTAAAGAPILSVQPGQRFSWIVNLCLHSGVSVSAHFKLIRLANKEMPDLQVAERTALVGPEKKRCGPFVNSWSIPLDSLPGHYEVRRSVIVREGSFFPLIQDFEPIRIIVVAPADRLPPLESIQPQSLEPITPINPAIPSDFFHQAIANKDIYYIPL